MCEKNKVKEINIIWIIIESSEWKIHVKSTGSVCLREREREELYKHITQLSM